MERTDLIQQRTERLEQQLANLNNEITQEVREILDVIDLLPARLGCKAFDESLEDVILIIMLGRFVVSEYPGITAAEVDKAFKLAAKAELMLDGKPIVLSTYGHKMNEAMMGRVLTAYTRHLQHIRSQAAGFVPRNKTLPDVKSEPITPEQAYEMLVEYCGESKVLPAIFGLYSTVYQYLLESETITDWPEERFNAIRAEVKLAMAASRPVTRLDRIKDTDLDSEFKRRCVIAYMREQGFKT
jgi:hypothetical protein